MKLPPRRDKIGSDEVIYYSMVSGPEDDEFHKLIGKIVVEFGRLEYSLKASIEALNRSINPTEDFGFIEGMTKPEELRTFPANCDHLLSLYNVSSNTNEKKSAAIALMADLKAINERRNDVVHGCWCTAKATGYILLRSKYDKPGKSAVQWSYDVAHDELLKLYKHINVSRFALMVLIGEGIGVQVPFSVADESIA